MRDILLTVLAVAAAVQSVISHAADVPQVTKFEVHATDKLIPAGHIDEVTKLPYLVTVPPCMQASVALRSHVTKDKTDIVIDWGDGTSIDLHKSNTTTGGADRYNYAFYEAGDPNEYWIDVAHTYKEPGRYIITIKGTQYWALNNNGSSIISRVFAADLPIASNVVNLASFAGYSKKLLKVDIPKDYVFGELENVSYLFAGSQNLLMVTGIRKRFKGTKALGVFADCTGLLRTDYKVTPEQQSCQSLFRNCGMLYLNVRATLPKKFHSTPKMEHCFTGCNALYDIPKQYEQYIKTQVKTKQQAEAETERLLKALQEARAETKKLQEELLYMKGEDR